MVLAIDNLSCELISVGVDVGSAEGDQLVLALFVGVFHYIAFDFEELGIDLRGIGFQKLYFFILFFKLLFKLKGQFLPFF